MEWTLYRDLFGGWRWEVRHANGEVTDSKESYDTRAECAQAAADARALLESATPAAARPSRAPRRSLLCVLGCGELQQSLEDGLDDYHVVHVSRAFEAIRRLGTDVFDAYVLDYWIPDWTGVHLCREIRRSDPHGPICFYTSAGTEDQRRRALRAGADAYVCAPAGVSALREELASLLHATGTRSLHARIDEERAIAEELQRRAVVAIAHSEHARRLAADATERVARAKGRAAFVSAGGTPADFERWWQQSYTDALQRHGRSRDDSTAATG